MKRLSTWILLGLIGYFNFSCSDTEADYSGTWRAQVETSLGWLPFELQVDGLSAVIVNGEERLAVDTVYFQGDSVVFDMEVLEGKIVAFYEDGELNGRFTKLMSNQQPRTANFVATKGEASRFVQHVPSNVDVSGKWEVIFTEPDGATYPALGTFTQTGDELSGTFLTETGDYRFLAGNVVGDTMKLSCFDGTHVFLFTALVKGDSLKNGKFSASLTYEETWEGVRNENAELANPASLTYIKEGFEKVEFSFPNTKGELVSLSDAAYKGKVVIVQILGTWCPNCMDETKFLAPWYEKNKSRGVEVVGLAFEKNTDPAYAFPKIDKMKKRFNVGYDILLAGQLNKTEAQKQLPMLNKIISYPTTIFIDKTGAVRKIHTGFSGPGTGVYYDEFVNDFNETMDQLLAES